MKHLNKTQKSILLIVLFCAILQLIRVQYTQSLFFSFLLWNLFLACIPYIVSEVMKKRPLTKTKIIIGTSFWLLFLPNAPYMITDFIHLHHSKSTMIWYDLFMIFCYANTGLLLSIVSMHTIYKIIQKNWTLTIANYFIIGVVFLCGFGIYLGRFLRFNSWDIFTTPLQTLKQSLTSFTNQNAWFVSIGFGSLLWIMFSLYKTLLIVNKEK
ncbi:DUF1361 domain-containing protein [uncultured Tenacibaculum sp.]|uniref:DUF1361 domain-containing protein n=1 Tax=uncultured Tenacibaculum sp. TaxID=174713 RepID=UPI00260570FC|nr:DUF1361 domain-containing protein [uncultured Tenacibaculum sp.]